MASKRKPSKRPLARNAKGRFISKTDAAFAKREIDERKKDTKHAKATQRRFSELFNPDRKRVEDSRGHSTEIVERKYRQNKRAGVTQYQQGPYRVTVYRYRGTATAGRAKLKDFISEAPPDSMTWINVERKGQSAGTKSAPPAITYRRIDLHLTNRYVRFELESEDDDEETEPIYQWEAVIMERT